MRVFVTGAAGQVGIELCNLNRKEDCVIAGASKSELDITDKSATFSKITSLKPDIIINAAAYTAVDKAETETDLADAINRQGPANLAEVCHEINIPLIHISTDYVFDGSKASSYNEQDSVNPINVYGKTKEAGESAIRETLQQHIILRTSWVFSAHRSNFVKTMLRLAKDRDSLNIVSDQSGGPTSAKSIAATCIELAKSILQNDNKRWGTYHYSGAEPTNWCDFAKAIIESTGNPMNTKVNPITTEEYPTPAARPRNSILNCQKIHNNYGIMQPDWQKDLDDVLKDILESSGE